MSYRLQVRLSAEDHARLEAAAANLGLPLSTHARSLILAGLRGHVGVEAVLAALAEDGKLRYRLQKIMTLLPQNPD